MIESLGGEVVKAVFLMELAGLKGRERLEGYDVDVNPENLISSIPLSGDHPGGSGAGQGNHSGRNTSRCGWKDTVMTV